MNRRRSQSKLYSFKKNGIFSRFETPRSIVIESILTSFHVSELNFLTLARDISNDLDFDLLIQRDIDENRATSDISKYICSEGKEAHPDRQNLVFLPPLIAAIVTTDKKRKLENYYPNEKLISIEDDYGLVYQRQWGACFEVKNYEDKVGGAPLYNDTIIQKEKGNPIVEMNQAEIGISLSISKTDPGAKLVVIDGQHRLFALQHTAKNNRDAVENMHIPVLIVYAPDSTEKNNCLTLNVPEVFRRLFVDVNSTARNVSGHFVILLSDTHLGHIICRAFCSKVLREFYKMGLAQIEWNTRTDKESKTITKEYTLTSIGVIDVLLEDVFSNPKQVDVLRYMLNIDSCEFEFGEDEDGNEIPEPKSFPWMGFLFKHKTKLHELAKNNIAPCLIEIFFKSKQYSRIIGAFRDAYDKIVQKEIDDTTSASHNAAKTVSEFLLNNIHISLDRNKEKEILSEFKQKYADNSKDKFEPIIRNNVFQRGMLNAWINVVGKGMLFNLRPIHVTIGFNDLLDKAIESNLFKNDVSHLYLQNSVYDGVRIKPTLGSRRQISRLILALLGKNKYCNQIVKIIQNKDEISEDDLQRLKEKLTQLGVESASHFIDDLRKARNRRFVQTFASNMQLFESERVELHKFKEEQDKAKSNKRTDKTVVIPEDFDNLVEKLTKAEFDLAQSQLEGILGYSMFEEADTEELEEE